MGNTLGTNAPIRGYAIAACGSLVGVGLVVLATPAPTAYTPWLFSYSDGILRRALVGTVASWFGPVTVDLVSTAGLVLAATLVVAVMAAMTRASLADDGRVSLDRAAVVAAFVTSAGGFVFLAMRTIRLDHAVMLLGVAATVALCSQRSWRIPAASVLLVLAVLVHDAAMLVVGVWVAALTAYMSEDGRRITAAVWTGAPAALVTVAARTWTPDVPAGTLRTSLASATDINVYPSLVRTLYDSSSDTLAFAWDRMASTGWFEFPLAGLAVAPLLVACVVVMRTQGIRWSHLGRPDRWLFAVSFTPLLLTVSAVDYGRWWAFTGWLFTGTTLLTLRKHGRGRVTLPMLAAVAAVSLGTLVSGPMDHQAFIWLEAVV